MKATDSNNKEAMLQLTGSNFCSNCNITLLFQAPPESML